MLQRLLVQPVGLDQLEEFLAVLVVNFAEVLEGVFVSPQVEIYLVPPVCGRGMLFQLVQERQVFLGILLGPLCHEQNLLKE